MMPERLDLFSIIHARAERDLAMARAENAMGNAVLKTAAAEALRAIARRQRLITSDDVWAHLVAAGSATEGNPSVMGCVFKEAQRAGVIEPTEHFRISIRVSAHARPVRVWQSLIVEDKP
jgi:hypothetical protein